jgi:hypothetical protein
LVLFSQIIGVECDDPAILRDVEAIIAEKGVTLREIFTWAAEHQAHTARAVRNVARKWRKLETVTEGTHDNGNTQTSRRANGGQHGKPPQPTPNAPDAERLAADRALKAKRKVQSVGGELSTGQ